MAISVSPSVKIFTLAGVVCLLIPLSLFGLLIYAANLGSSHSERIALFDSYVPSFLQAGFSTTFLSFIFCILAILLSGKNLKVTDVYWRVVNYVVLLISGVLVFLNLWGML